MEVDLEEDKTGLWGPSAESRPSKVHVVDLGDVERLVRNKEEVLLVSPAIVDLVGSAKGRSVSWGNKTVNVDAVYGKITYKSTSLGFERGRGWG